MRLIRLTTEDNRCVFDSVFNSDLVIKPYTKIALSSFTTQLNNLNMTIDAQNNQITYTVDGNDNIKQLSLPEGVYTSSTMQQFWTITTQLFNKSMEYTKNQINRQWWVGVDGGRTTFECIAGNKVFVSNNETTDVIQTKNILATGQGSSRKVYRDPASPAGNTSYIYVKSTNNKGASSLRATIFSDTGTNNGFILGYTAVNPAINTEVIDVSDYLYALEFVKAGVDYKFIINGVSHDTDITATVGDVLEINTYNGNLNILVYRGDSDDVEVISTNDYDHITNLFPLLLFKGSSTLVNQIQFTTDPIYDKKKIKDNNETILYANNNITPIPATPIITKNFLLFNNPDLAIILGYKQPRFPSIDFDNSSLFQVIGQKPFELRDFSESYVIELLNLKLDSMDSQSKGPKNFLYVIPQLSAIREHVVYQVPQLIFLNLNNATDINMRELRVRVLKDDLTPITCYGISEMVIILKEKDEI